VEAGTTEFRFQALKQIINNHWGSSHYFMQGDSTIQSHSHKQLAG